MRDLDKILSLPADYVDVRHIASDSQKVMAKDGAVESVDAGVYGGVGIRVLVGGQWGFAVESDEEKALSAAEDALRAAKALAQNAPRARDPFLAPIDIVEEELTFPAEMPTVEEATSLALDCEAHAKHDKVVSTQTMLANARIEKSFHSSEGAAIMQCYLRSFLVTSAVAKDGATLQEAYQRSTSFEAMRHDPAIAADAAAKAVALLDGKPCPSGTLPVVMDPELAAVFLHEAFGHMAEADAVTEGQSILAGRIGESIAAPGIAIVDDGTADGYGRVWYDDEGVPGKRNVLVEDGVLAGYMQSRESAAALEAAPTGNARAQGAGDPPIVRMTNTYFENGDASFADILADVRDGIYLKGSRGGQTNPARGVFQFAAAEGYLIEDGELGDLVRNAGLSGATLDVLTNVSLIGDDFVIDAPGHCGKKGQSMPVDGGGPHIATVATVGGA